MPECSSGWYVFGAQAVQVWGQPRLTADVGVTARLREDDHATFVSRMRAAGFDLRVRDSEAFVRKTRVFPFVHRGSEIPVDVVLAGPGLEEEFLQRAKPVDVGGATVPVISAEDLIVTKMLAGRPKDIEDVRGIVGARLGKLDVRRIRRLLRLLEGAIDQTDLRPLFERELAAARRRKARRPRRRRA